VNAKQDYKTGDAGRQPSLFIRIPAGFESKVNREMAVTEAVDEVLAAHCSGKQHHIALAQWVEAANSTAVFCDRFAEPVEQAIRLGRIVDDRESLQVAFVGGEGDFGIPVKVGDSFGHGIPADDKLTILPAPAADTEFIGMVDNRLDSQYAPFFVVHFNTVTLHPMFDPRTGPALLEFVHDLPFEVPVEFPSEEGHDILGAEAHRGVPQQCFIQAFQRGAVLEQDVGCELGLVDDPIVPHASKQGREMGIDLLGEGIENLRFDSPDKLVGETLSALGVLDGNEDVFDLSVVDSMLVHLPGEQVMKIDVDLDHEGEPGLDSDMHKAELPVEVIEVEAKAPGVVPDDTRLAVTVGEFETLALLDGGEDADETFSDVVHSGDLARTAFFSGGAVDVNERAARSLCYGNSVFLEGLGVSLDEAFEIFEEKTFVVHEVFQRFRVAKREVPLEKKAVEAG
jgi:hypothetical protein